ncbi:MAG: succinylglutamate desuccinylase/aspartoacylase family protein [Phycisphaerales bacterium]|nr:succinylglutamate desuccinylase/aspartoacylase family protein [Planctomycetota bacterium]MCH8507623.1 succinylglutamate desuccinylase/aspartoacylase family protein [Phycisphaerales bacterium]
MDGPTVLIIGGIHGNEPAGAHAAERILDWTPIRGRLVVVPRANVPALEARTRRMPDLPRAESDLNRQFPMTSEETPTGELAAALWSLVCEIGPNLLLDLHEGFHFTQIEPRSVGSSIIADRREDTKALARIMLDALNPTIEDPLKQFVLKSPMVSGSMARAASEVLNIPSMILETTTRGQPIELRSDQHLILVRSVLSELGMSGCADIRGTPALQDLPD